MFKDLKYKKNDIYLNFTSILSSNNVKFNDIRFQEYASKHLNIDYSKVSYIANLLCSNILKCNKDYIKSNTNSEAKANSSPKKSKTKLSPKKKTKKEQDKIFKNTYYETDLFEFIRNNELDNKMIEKLCKISGSDSMWTDNEIISNFTNNVNNLIANDDKKQNNIIKL